MERSHTGARRAAALVAAALLVWAASATGAVGQVALPRTGQTTSYSAGDDGDLQRGVAWPIPRFTANPDGTITDGLTGLVWLGDANCAATIGRDPDATGDGSMEWPDAIVFVDDINDGSANISACGHSGPYTGTYTDWRLPNVLEIESLANAEVVDHSAWLSGEGFAQVEADLYWASTTPPGNQFWAFTFDMSVGRLMQNLKETTFQFVWIVRGGPDETPDPTVPANLWKPGFSASDPWDHGVAWPPTRFFDHGDGTATDLLTGLMWLKDVGCLGNADWPGALDRVADFNLPAPVPGYSCAEYTQGTYGDWRVPNRKETLSLVDNSVERPSLPPGHPFVDIAPFRANPGSTTDAASASNFWLLQTWIFGGYGPAGKTGGSPYAVWPVRGPSADPIPAISMGWQIVLVTSVLGAAAFWIRRRSSA